MLASSLASQPGLMGEGYRVPKIKPSDPKPHPLNPPTKTMLLAHSVTKNWTF